jgi:hypothetical protein
MKIEMPLPPDPQGMKLRRVVAEMPDDTTQEEFWNFVVLVGTQMFGEKTPREGRDNEFHSRWDLMGSLERYGKSMLRKT